MSSLARRAFLGAELPADAEAFTAAGVRIAGVVEGGIAAGAGLAAGDVVVAIAGRPVRSLAELAAALRAAGALAEVELAIVRDGEPGVRRAAVIATPGEPGAVYGELAVPGARLRTIEIRSATPRAVVLVIQGIACESVDHALAPDAPLAGLVEGWTRAGFDVVRFDKRGVGDSEGNSCGTTDFATELADARAALACASARAAARGVPLVVFGHSVGGIVAALVAGDAPLAGIAVYGAPVMPWIECLLDSTRRQLALRGADDSEVAARVAAIHALRDTGELNGRSAAYHAQLAEIDVAAAWRAVGVPVLVVRGEHDWVVRDDDQARVGELARGPTTIADVPGLDHVLGWHADRAASLADYGSGRFDPAIVTATVAWLDRIAGRGG
jgi:alpha-beta hydrolase superfamily lysophospholipase